MSCQASPRGLLATRCVAEEVPALTVRGGEKPQLPPPSGFAQRGNTPNLPFCVNFPRMRTALARGVTARTTGLGLMFAHKLQQRAMSLPPGGTRRLASRPWGRWALAVGFALGATGRTTLVHADPPVFVDWSSLLPGLTDAYVPTSANDCVAGRPDCVRAVIQEMRDRFEPRGRSCDHDAVFALAYLRTTQTYQWATAQSDFFAEAPWMNHYDAVFAKYYFRAYDDYVAGRRTSVPEAWLVAFDASRDRNISGSGSLLLGMNAHVNRDLAFVLAAIGLVQPDGTSRKEDHDKVNQFLNLVMQPLLRELSARFDPDVIDVQTPMGTGYTALLQLLVLWREVAWRNAELLVNAPTEQARSLVAQQIETDAGLEARSIAVANGYIPLLTSSTARDAYCAAQHDGAAPLPYAFGMPAPY